MGSGVRAITGRDDRHGHGHDTVPTRSTRPHLPAPALAPLPRRPLAQHSRTGPGLADGCLTGSFTAAVPASAPPGVPSGVQRVSRRPLPVGLRLAELRLTGLRPAGPRPAGLRLTGLFSPV